jgi:hypothetical protein
MFCSQCAEQCIYPTIEIRFGGIRTWPASVPYRRRQRISGGSSQSYCYRDGVSVGVAIGAAVEVLKSARIAAVLPVCVSNSSNVGTRLQETGWGTATGLNNGL